jgi:selT/selW/selH-like putative selenoprotein
MATLTQQPRPTYPRLDDEIGAAGSSAASRPSRLDGRDAATLERSPPRAEPLHPWPRIDRSAPEKSGTRSGLNPEALPSDVARPDAARTPRTFRSKGSDAEPTFAEKVAVSSEPDVADVSEAVRIEYCVPGNCERRARELSDSIRREFGVPVRLLASRGGVFEVHVAGRLVFSKRATRRFPDVDEVFYHVRQWNGTRT